MDSTGTTRDVVATFSDYRRAERAVDDLADRGFPVERLAIVGANLRSVEEITGRRGYGRAAGAGALSGAIIGVLVGWLLGLLSVVAPLTSAVLLGLWGLVFGAVIGAVVGLVGHALMRGRRDFSSVSTVRAEHYDVLAEPNVADEGAEHDRDSWVDQTDTGRMTGLGAGAVDNGVRA